MIIYLVGISCIGKTTIGKMLAEQIRFAFYDIDEEVERYYQKSIERLQDESFTMNGFREKASVVLDNILSDTDYSVISGTPSGLKYSYWKVLKKHKSKKEIFTIHIQDSYENVLKRLTFYDKNSKPIVVEMDELKKRIYLKKIKADYNFFKNSYKRADLQINIENISLKDITNFIISKLEEVNIMPTTNKNIMHLVNSANTKKT